MDRGLIACLTMKFQALENLWKDFHIYVLRNKKPFVHPETFPVDKKASKRLEIIWIIGYFPASL